MRAGVGVPRAIAPAAGAAGSSFGARRGPHAEDRYATAGGLPQRSGGDQRPL